MESNFTTGQSNKVPKVASLTSWRPPPENSLLRNDEVHVWRVCLDRNMSYVQRLEQILSTGEKIRARRFYFEKDRKHFVVARGLLRIILSRYLDMEPSRLRFCYSPNGKPSLVTPSNEEGLSFNVSHSCGIALYAVNRRREVGIDLERIRMDFACEQIAELFFSPQENAMLRALTASSVKRKAFFNCWTRKEAYIKARGVGFSLPLDQFDVSLTPGEQATLLNSREDSQEVSRWSFQELIIAPSFVATLVVEGHGWQLVCLE